MHTQKSIEPEHYDTNQTNCGPAIHYINCLKPQAKKGKTLNIAYSGGP